MAKFSPAKKSLGQHFLYDQRVLNKIVRACELTGEERVLEVGPGRGHLTKLLAESGAHVTAVEVDPDLYNGPLKIFESIKNVDVLLGDARAIDLDSIFGEPFSYKFVANLPYNSATNILRYVICRKVRPSRVVVMLQREVARNVVSGVGKRGILSVLVQTFATGKLLFTVPPSAFRPKPKVTSAVISLDCKREDVIEEKFRDPYFRFIVAGFSSPRKQIHNSLANGLNIESSFSTEILERCGINHRRRPATLEISEWLTLFEYLRKSDWAQTKLFLNEGSGDV